MAHGKRGDIGRIAAQERRLKALELRKAGLPLRGIAKALDCSYSQARRDVNGALAELHKQQMVGAEQLRALQLARLEMVLQAQAVKVKASDPTATGLWLKTVDQISEITGLKSPSITFDNRQIILHWGEFPTIDNPMQLSEMLESGSEPESLTDKSFYRNELEGQLEANIVQDGSR